MLSSAFMNEIICSGLRAEEGLTMHGELFKTWIETDELRVSILSHINYPERGMVVGSSWVP